MSEDVSAFQEKVIPCPVCETENVQQKLKTRLCSPAEQESDQHVIRWNWTDPRFEGIKSQYYYLMHCPTCYFTDLVPDYENPSGDPKFGSIKRLYQAVKGPEKEFLKRVSRHVYAHPMTFESAMNAHLAAIYIQELPKETELRNLVKLGRLYLRAAWLWREQNPQSKNVSASSVLADIERAAGEAERPFRQAEERFELLQNLLVRRVKSFNLSPEDEVAHPYQKSIQTFQRSMADFRRSLGTLRQLLQQDAAGTLTTGKKGEGQYAGFASYFDFLSAMTQFWTRLPLNEKDSLQQAVRYFTDAYFIELNFDEVEKVMTTNALIVDLHLRLEDFDNALKAIASVYKAGMDGKLSLQKLLRERKKEGKLTEKDAMAIESQISRIDYVLQKTAERRHEVRDLKLQKYLPVMEPILEKNKGAEPGALAELLVQAGIPEDVAEAYLEKGRGEESSREKRGLLGLFGKKG